MTNEDLLSMTLGKDPASPSARVDRLKELGVEIPDPRQVYVSDEVLPERISPSAVLHPGTRLTGPRTFIGPAAKIGTEGPATIKNAIVAEDAEVASGYIENSVLLAKSRAGSNAHFRIGTLLEEEASTAHAVGLKHTVLMSYVTFGSLINFCDGLVSGGSSRQNHTEVGSGFIHFNYTPWGEHGDKATASLVGNVPDGVFLNESKIFLGGLGGLVGPQSVGFGSFTIAGQVVRAEVPKGRIFADSIRAVDEPWEFGRTDRPFERIEQNLEYIGNLVALKAWYESVRLKRIPAQTKFEHKRIVLRAAIELLAQSIAERKNRLMSFAKERGISSLPMNYDTLPCPLKVESSEPYIEHTDWVRLVVDSEMSTVRLWLTNIVSQIKEMSEQYRENSHKGSRIT